MILIVGLGNPGDKYKKTRHNVGFEVLDAFAKNLNINFSFSEKYDAEIAQGMIQFDTKRVRVLLVKPQTYMNNSGESVAKVVNFYKFRTDDQLFVIHDDIDIELGAIRIRLSGSSGGQKGVQSIIEKLGTDKFVRFRVGIRPKSGQNKPSEDFVLERFTKEENKDIGIKISEIVENIKIALDKGIINTTI